MSRRRVIVFTMAAVLAVTGLVWVPAAGGSVARAAGATSVALDGPQPIIAESTGTTPVEVGMSACCAVYPKQASTVSTDVRLVSDTSTPYTGATGSMDLTIDGVPFGSQPVVSGVAEFQVPPYSLGTHVLVATYSGDDTLASADAQMTVTIVPDFVDATSVGRNLTNFYPVKDHYRDAVTLRGRRGEPISVSIKIYSPRKKLVRSASVARGTGWYQYAWNGRTASGKLLAGGKYKLVQVLTDALGTKRTYTSYVNLSHKRIVTRTVTLTKRYTQASRRTGSWLGWTFTLPKAAVYKGLRAYVRGRSVMVPGGSFGGHDATACPIADWYPGCATRIGSIGYSLKWYSKKLSASEDHSGRTVKIYAWANPGGSVGVTHARVKVSYGVLR